MSEGGVDACPALGPDLLRGVKRIVESLGTYPMEESVVASEIAVRDLLRGWGRRVASHYDQKATDVRDLLLVDVANCGVAREQRCSNSSKSRSRHRTIDIDREDRRRDTDPRFGRG